MYDSDLKYIAISYRWGELSEQLLNTPDYTAHIISFDLVDFQHLCEYIYNEHYLNQIPYLWIDAISVDQHNKEKRKETILKMNQIYKIATCILAVPDLHRLYLWKNTENREVIELIYKYKDIIHEEIFNHDQSTTSSIHNSLSDSIQHTNNNNNHYSIIQRLKNKLIKECKENEQLRKENKHIKKEFEELKRENELKKKDEDLKKAYKFLAFLIDDWSNRA